MKIIHFIIQVLKDILGKCYFNIKNGVFKKKKSDLIILKKKVATENKKEIRKKNKKRSKKVKPKSKVK